jgi:SpoVK/Ycf46/Vps4 family AAA+-type ATPase
LEEAKKLLKEAVVMPIKYPEFFTGRVGTFHLVISAVKTQSKHMTASISM